MPLAVVLWTCRQPTHRRQLYLAAQDGAGATRIHDQQDEICGMAAEL